MPILPLLLLLLLPTSLYSLKLVEVTSSVGIPQKTPSNKFGGPCVADLDGDGHYDFILSHHNSQWTRIFFGSANGTFTQASFRTETFDVHGITVARSTAYSRNTMLSVSVGGGMGTKLRSAEVFFVTPERKFISIGNRLGLGKRKGRGRNTVFLEMGMRSRAEGRMNGGGPDIIFTNYVGRVLGIGLIQFGYENKRGVFEYRRLGEFENEQRGSVEVTDVDGDGLMEVVSITTFKFYKLERPFWFKERTKEILPEGFEIEDLTVSSVAEGDFDNDGDFDLYVGRTRTKLITRLKRPIDNIRMADIYLENDGGRYVDSTRSVGGAGGRGDTMGVTVGDFDNDGWLDVYICRYRGRDTILRNLGNGRFAKIVSGVAKPRTTVGNHAVAVDYDLDGRLDLIVGQGAVNGIQGYYRVMRNVMEINGDRGWLLVTVGSEVFRGVTALHAVVSVEVGDGRVMSRRVGSVGAQGGGGSYLDTVHFGLGNVSVVSRVRVKWTNGIEEEKRRVGRNQRLYFGNQ